ncbi:hypothetical protein PQ460_15735 [Paenibacillus sp. KACC 21273]|uniref:hypothetical protein n=1 Tax=Paenibacillus sp. KACC 21273 TaxID=3025665 RepID=UPI002365921C|nr:hypothetical protein [Paenibacillus sp. KACC 21273]WDF49455.1 hypothetical protein PQ460_15735 [Paenibacillus sp. KACC 21273]
MISIDRTFAIKLSVMIRSQLIDYQYYYPFCDAIIEKNDKTPYWIIELSMTKDPEIAGGIALLYASLDACEEFDIRYKCNLYIACLYVKYVEEDLSWSNFLLNAGMYTDGMPYANKNYDYFFNQLNVLENNKHHTLLLEQQRQEIFSIFEKEINEISTQLEFLKIYYKLYLSEYNET